jgi:hypothetical protein
MSRISHSSSSLKSHKFFNTVDKVPSTSTEFNFGDNINQWKKYLEVDEFVSRSSARRRVVDF